MSLSLRRDTYIACGVDGLAAEHFIYADAIIHIHLSLLFNSFISHGYLPRDFMKTAIVPIIKNKAGNSSDKANYRPIALVTACSKIFESCLLIMFKNICILMINSSDLKANTLRICVYLL